MEPEAEENVPVTLSAAMAGEAAARAEAEAVVARTRMEFVAKQEKEAARAEKVQLQLSTELEAAQQATAKTNDEVLLLTQQCDAAEAALAARQAEMARTEANATRRVTGLTELASQRGAASTIQRRVRDKRSREALRRLLLRARIVARERIEAVALATNQAELADALRRNWAAALSSGAKAQEAAKQRSAASTIQRRVREKCGGDALRNLQRSHSEVLERGAEAAS